MLKKLICISILPSLYVEVTPNGHWLDELERENWFVSHRHSHLAWIESVARRLGWRSKPMSQLQVAHFLSPYPLPPSEKSAHTSEVEMPTLCGERTGIADGIYSEGVRRNRVQIMSISWEISAVALQGSKESGESVLGLFQYLENYSQTHIGAESFSRFSPFPYPSTYFIWKYKSVTRGSQQCLHPVPWKGSWGISVLLPSNAMVLLQEAK